VIYYYFPGEQQIWLITLYVKSAIEFELRARQAAKLAKQRKSRR
jgi:hypothetical protein